MNKPVWLLINERKRRLRKIAKEMGREIPDNFEYLGILIDNTDTDIELMQRFSERREHGK